MNCLIDKSGIELTVTGIRWERVHLMLEVCLKQEKHQKFSWDELKFYGVKKKGAGVCFNVEAIDSERAVLKANITNNGECHCIPHGTYRIYACREDQVLAEAMTAPELSSSLADLSRNFLYTKRRNVFTVSFFIDGDETKLPFRMHVLSSTKAEEEFLTTPSFMEAFEPIKNLKRCYLSRSPIVRRAYKLYSKMYKNQRKNTVLFLSEQNDVIASNLKAVSDRMMERKLDSRYHILYSAHSPLNKKTIKEWFRLAKKLAQSGTIVIDDHVQVFDWLKLDPDTKVIQLWHAGAGFKSSGYSRWGSGGCPAPQSCHRQYTYGIAGSKNIAHFFSEVWGINDEQVLPTGMPRMDEFLDEQYIEAKKCELYEKYPMCQGKKVILFAPTYRGNNKIAAYYPYDLIDFEKLYNLCGDEYVVLFKMHPWVNNDIVIEPKYQDKFLDVKNYPKINDLFYITELLITDYSSNIFEYSLMRKPMLFFAYDKIQYSYSRGFHRAYEESAPGKVCYTFEEVLRAIEEKDFEFEKVEEYVEKHFDYIDSNASDRVIDWLILDQMPQEFKDALKNKKEEVKKMTSLTFPWLVEKEEEEA